MDKIAVWISTNAYLIAGGLVVTFAGFVVMVIQQIKQRKIRELAYSLSTNVLIDDRINSIPGLKVSIDQTVITSLYVTTLHFWNSGNTRLTKNDIYTKHPLTITLVSDTSTIHSVIKVYESADTCEITQNPQVVDGHIAVFSFEELGKKQGGIINIYHTSAQNKPIEISGKMIEGTMRNKTRNEENNSGYEIVFEVAKRALMFIPVFGSLVYLTLSFIEDIKNHKSG